MRLHIGKNHGETTIAVQSVFRLIGDDEDALSFGLGYLLAYDPDFCVRVIRACGVSPPRALRIDYSVFLQEVTGRGFGRRDIVIESRGMRVVLEAKIGGALPTQGQLLKYASERELWKRFNRKAIVSLTQVGLPSETQRLVGEKLSKMGVSFHHVQWQRIAELVLGHRPRKDTPVSRHLFREYARFIRRDYRRMGYYDAEILIQDVNLENARIYDEGWMYVTAIKDKKAPLYFAPYFTRQNDKEGVSRLSRVENVQIDRLADTEDWLEGRTGERYQRWRRGLSLLRKRAGRGGWLQSEVQLFFLGPPMTISEPPLTKRIFRQTGPGKEIPNQIPKGFSLRFDELLRATGKSSG
ncbi:MAG: hypothetical protein OXS35_08425 [Dehalococcoidia bacterium]|nr:hypothetical protein [Dehalococcoidia bacterium]